MLSFLIHLLGGFTLDEINYNGKSHAERRQLANKSLWLVVNRILAKVDELRKAGTPEYYGACFSNSVLFPMPINDYSKYLVIKKLEGFGYHVTRLSFHDGLNVFWGETAKKLRDYLGAEAASFEEALVSRNK